jgi:conjugative transfer signal peptidase TraF
MEAAFLATLVAVALIATIVLPPGPWLLWNASPSSPVGLYAIEPARKLRIGDVAVAWPPPGARDLAAVRGYLPRRVPLVKRVGAITGDRVCASGQWIEIDAIRAAKRRALDSVGRRLPHWHGCRRLRLGELFLLSRDPLAFDGRYFGVTAHEDVIGKASLLWRAR